MKRNPPCDAKWLKFPMSSYNPNIITPANIVAQYCGEPFVLSGGKLLPGVREELALKTVFHHSRVFPFLTVPFARCEGRTDPKTVFHHSRVFLFLMVPFQTVRIPLYKITYKLS